jgi:hypothetical protein
MGSIFLRGLSITMRIVLYFLLIFLLGCSGKKNPCMEEWDCRDCNCMFDKIQQNLHDAQKLQRIQECYDKACK